MPRSLNRCTFIGRLANDPTPGAMPDGAVTTQFIVAVPDERRTTLVPVTAVGKLADICNRILTKDREVYIEGQYQNRRYNDRQGVEQLVTEIKLENMQMFNGGRSRLAINNDDPTT